MTLVGLLLRMSGRTNLIVSGREEKWAVDVQILADTGCLSVCVCSKCSSLVNWFTNG